MSETPVPSPLPLVVLAGLDKSAVLRALLADGERIEALVLPFGAGLEARLGELPALAAAHRIPVLRPRRAELEAALRGVPATALLSLGYPHLLTPAVLSIFRWNLNTHPTLLPKYRGPATAWHVLAAGERESGVTVHHIDAGMDTGPVLVQLRCPLTPFDTLRSLKRKTDGLEPEAVRQALALLRAGRGAGAPQDESAASTFREKRTPDDSRVDPARPLAELYHAIRACDPDRFPAFFEVDGQRVGIRLFRLNRPAGEPDTI